ncbi:Protein CBG14015 [Caenorhabditis briggsae]|uniref:Protein CBG14015 n=1 Tax=Caenorhabditis briggsae TaxID=6238 RepID=A8XJ72_CAEBR|nr:Protein CBG14015 [Caenorhabditis briggsae]CAP32697.2 Protein CBG14015 [Caenorhabditis briggsae]
MIFDEVHPTNGKRYVAFGSKVGLEMLEKSSLLLSDGTFSVAQPPFVQLWTIHATFSESTFPVVHVLMSGRQIVDYDYVLGRLKSIIPLWDPQDYLGDLEIGQATAIKNAFPNIRQTYCYFHLLQAWFRRLKQLKLQDSNSRNAEFRKVSAERKKKDILKDQRILKVLDARIALGSQLKGISFFKAIRAAKKYT